MSLVFVYFFTIKMSGGHTLMKLENAFVFLPFAYGGNPATESGPRAFYDWILNNNPFDNMQLFMCEQSVEESALAYLNRVEKDFANILSINFNKTIVFGGNHLSLLPIYKQFYSNAKNILTLDAHRDYYPENSLNHATFLKFLYHPNILHIIAGVRDDKHHKETHPNITYIHPAEFHLVFNMFSSISLDYIDIDLDVLDSGTVSSFCCPIEGGLQWKQVMQVVNFAKINGCNCISFSEYIPYWDTNQRDLQKIISLVQSFIN